MPRQRHADLFALHAVAVLGDHVAAGQHIAQRFLQRRGGALHALRRADHIHAIIILQIEGKRSGMRIIPHFKALRMKYDAPVFHMHQLLYAHIGIDRIQTRVQQFGDDSSALDVPMSGQHLLVLYPHIASFRRIADQKRISSGTGASPQTPVRLAMNSASSGASSKSNTSVFS